MRKAVILNSRQSIRPYGSDPWIINSGMAVKYAAQNELCLLTSVGLAAWEMTLYYASKFKYRQNIYVHLQDSAKKDDVFDYYSQQFKLDNDLVGFIPIITDNSRNSNHQFRSMRDQKIIEHADIIYLVSLRPNGNLEKIMTEFDNTPKIIDNQFRIDYVRKRRKLKVDIDEHNLLPNSDQRLAGYIIHWTRTANRPWPGELIYDYYDSIVETRNSYSRTAADTLYHIFKEGKLRASSRHYHKGTSAVAFSDLAPSKAIKLMKWRARYREMSFEPFGVAIDKKYAISIGIRPVIYGHSEDYESLALSDRPYFQSFGKKAYWLPENEWRYIEDLVLKHIPAKYLKAVIWHDNDINRLRQIFQGDIIALTD